MVGGAEVDFDAPLFLNFCVAVELGAVVSGDGFKHVRSSCNELVETSVCGVGGVIFELADEREAGGSFDERKDAVRSGSMDGIDFPVAKFLS